MFFRQGILICILMLGFLTGCALSPQALTPNPVITQSLPQVGQGRAINVKVVDGRSSETIGTRGGLYSSTSSLTVSANAIVPKLQQQAEQALINMGYKVQADGASATLNIIIDTITYKASEGSFTNSSDVKAVLRSQLQTPTKTYGGRYTASLSQSFSSAPNLETNNKLVSDVLTNALTSLFKDSQLTNSM